jgi:predicted dienelactone hydrolase
MTRRLLLLPLLAFATTATARDFNHGPFKTVGFTTLHFTKTSVTTAQPRPLDTLVWYPAVAGTGTPQGDVFTGATPLKRRFPLIMFSHGSCGVPGQSPFFTAGLASFGFVVVAPPHPGNETTDLPHCGDPAELVDSFANREADIMFVIDRMLAESTDPSSPFARRINAKRIGMSGHSFGGQTTLRIAADDSRVRAAVALAPAVEAIHPMIRIPTLVMGAELDSLVPFATDGPAAFDFLDGPRFLVELLNTGHCAFAVVCFPGLCGNGCQPGTASLDTTHTLTMRYAVPFFLRYLAGRGALPKVLSPGQAPSGVTVVHFEPHGSA